MLQANAVNLPFKEESFDIIICSELLEHLQDGMDKNALCEMARILKPGGRLLITVPSLDGIRSRSRLRNLGHTDQSGGEFHYRQGYFWQDIEAMVNQIPALNIKNKRYTLFILSELFADLLKLSYFKKEDLKEHSDLSKVKDSFLFRIYRLVFPLLYFGFLLEDTLLALLFKGHVLIAEMEKKI
jgi:SAM-dependent methyltransferase